MKPLKLFIIFIFALSAVSAEYMQNYRRGDYESCISDLKKLERERSLSSTEMTIFSECAFQSRNYLLASRIFNRIIKKDENSALRAARRLTDILQKGETGADYGPLLQYLIKNKNQSGRARKVINLLLQNNMINEFMTLYEAYPVYLNERQWSILTASLENEQFNHILQLAPLNTRQRQIQKARFYHNHEQTDKALQILNEPGSDLQTVKLKAEILYSIKQVERTYETLAELKKFGHNGYLQIAEFLYDRGHTDKALEYINEGIAEGHKLHEKKVFYLMTAGRPVEAAYLLEVYTLQGKIRSYRYHSLRQDYLRQGDIKNYFKGLQKAAREHTVLCTRAVETAIDWLEARQLTQYINRCPQYRRSKHLKSSLLNRLKSAERFDVLYLLLKDNETLTEREKWLTGLSMMLSEKKNYNGALNYFNRISDKSALKQSPEYLYYRALSLYNLKHFTEAAALFKKLHYHDSRHFYYRSLVFEEKWPQLSNALKKDNSTEKTFFTALWSIGNGQLNQAATLFETYLENGGHYGTEAVYYLFMIRYFRINDNLENLLTALLKFPGAAEPADITLEPSTDIETAGEFICFKAYWKARILLLHNKNDKAVEIFTALKKNPQAGLLQAEINFFLSLKTGKDRKDYIVSYPESPYRVFFNTP